MLNPQFDYRAITGSHAGRLFGTTTVQLAPKSPRRVALILQNTTPTAVANGFIYVSFGKANNTDQAIFEFVLAQNVPPFSVDTVPQDEIWVRGNVAGCSISIFEGVLREGY